MELTEDKVKLLIAICSLLIMISGWYQAWIKDKEVTATQQQVTTVANVYSTHYHYGECE